MSHVVKINLEIKSLAALKKAVKKLGLNFNEGVTQFEYYGSSKAACNHTINAGDTSKSVGVCATGKDGKQFELKWDPGYLGKAEELLGRNADNLKKEYAAAVATSEAEAQGMFVTRYDQKDGTIRLEAAYA